MASIAFTVVATLSVFRAWGQSARFLDHVPKFDDHHAIGWSVAWRVLEFRHLGWVSRVLVNWSACVDVCSVNSGHEAGLSGRSSLDVLRVAEGFTVDVYVFPDANRLDIIPLRVPAGDPNDVGSDVHCSPCRPALAFFCRSHSFGIGDHVGD